MFHMISYREDIISYRIILFNYVIDPILDIRFARGLKSVALGWHDILAISEYTRRCLESF